MHVLDDEDKTVVTATNAVFYPGRKPLDDYSVECPITKWIVHPDYEEKITTHCGADIALAEISVPPECMIGSPGLSAAWFEIQDQNAPICIYGYPGEKDKLGKLYGMKGSSNSLRIVKSTNKKDLIEYSDIDTSPGQSGSPILLQIELDDGSVEMIIGGIHVAEDPNKPANYGTLITKEKLDWIHQHRKLKLVILKSIKEIND